MSLNPPNVNRLVNDKDVILQFRTLIVSAVKICKEYLPTASTSADKVPSRDVHGIENPNGNGSPMVIPWEWDIN